MEEESTFDSVESFSQERWQHQEMIVVDPDKIILKGDQHFHKTIHKCHVCSNICRPQLRVKTAQGIRVERGEIMQHGPQLLLAEF